MTHMQADAVQGHPSTLTDYVAVVKRRKWVVIQAMIIVPVAAVLLTLHQQKVFSSSAQVLFIPKPSSSATNQGIPADRLVQTEVDLARLTPIATRVVQSVHAPGLTAGKLLAASSVTELANSNVLVFTVKNANAALSRRLATAYARAYTTYRSQASNARVVQDATSSAQLQPKPTRNLLIGVVLGLILGLGLAFLLEALDSRVRSAEEISARLGGLPLLARLPKPARKLRSKGQLAMVAVPDAPEAEAFRVLRTQLDLARLEHPTKTIMVTSAVDEEGKSTTAANLATALARAGRRVVLVDLDLYRPSVGDLFSVSGPGLSDVVLGTADLNDALVSIPIPAQFEGYGSGEPHLHGGNLDVLAAGQIPPDSGDFINTVALRDVLQRLEERADTVIIDTSPMLRAGDAMALSAKVDGILLVVRDGVVRRKMLGEIARFLERTPATKLGFVLTDVAVEPGYGYAYRRGYQASEPGSRQVSP